MCLRLIYIITIFVFGCSTELFEPEDCAGVIGGTAVYDCEGNCGGEATEDDCGGCMGGTTNYNGCLDENQDSYDDRDIEVLQLFINNSLETLNQVLDSDSSGAIEPLELGIQVWEYGRLIDWDCHNSYYDHCELSGEIPNKIGNLSKLTRLMLSHNQLTGSIPEEIGNLEYLDKLYIEFNGLTGEIPESIGNLTRLKTFGLGINQLSGQIPSTISNLSHLRVLRLFGNNLTGNMAIDFTNLSLLYHLEIFNNQLTGILPESICNVLINIPTLTYFSIRNNQFCPPYPECLVGEQFDDCGTDSLCEDDLNYPGPDEDGTEGNGILDEGESFYDYGPDGLPGTGDYGEGNGIFDEDYIDYQDISGCD